MEMPIYTKKYGTILHNIPIQIGLYSLEAELGENAENTDIYRPTIFLGSSHFPRDY